MNIYGIKLNSKIRYIHPEIFDICEEGEVFLSPEETVSPACHLYTDYNRTQYIGFEVSLRMKKSEMDSLLGKVGKEYIVVQE